MVPVLSRVVFQHVLAKFISSYKEPQTRLFRSNKGLLFVLFCFLLDNSIDKHYLSLSGIKILLWYTL